jgi:PKD repeat protein
MGTTNIGPCGCCTGTCANDATFSATPRADEECRIVDFSVANVPEECSCTYSWDFGDGSAAGSGSSPSHTYDCTDALIEYDVTLTVTCTDGTIKVVGPQTVTICPCESVCDTITEDDGTGTVCSGGGSAPLFATFTYAYGSEATVYRTPVGNGCTSEGTGCDIGSVIAGSYTCRLNETDCQCWELTDSLGSCSLEAQIDAEPDPPCLTGKTLEVIGARVCLSRDGTYFYALATIETNVTSVGSGCSITTGTSTGATFRAPHGGNTACDHLDDVTWECTGVTGATGCTEGTYDGTDIVVSRSSGSACDDCGVRHHFDRAGAIAACSLVFTGSP